MIRRLLFRLMAGLVGLVLITGIGAAVLIWLTLPGSPSTAVLPGLSAPVFITFDRNGVPYIRSSSFADAAEALGYLHARDRLFQMEFMLRAASGRLADWFGPNAVNFDREMRTLDLFDAAAGSAAYLSPPARATLESYARGVNAYIAQRGCLAAPEFLLLGRPERWRVEDSLLWGEWLAYSLSGNGNVKLERLSLEGRLPTWKILELWPPPDGLKLSHQGFLDPALPRAALALLNKWPRFPDRFTEPATASNEFAVAGIRSATGAPLLAGDPHLGFAFPGLWYLARIDTPEQHLAGATGPGAPFIVFGHNNEVAWTFTNNGADVQDIFIEHGAGVAPNGAALYATPHGPQPFRIRPETITVRGQSPIHFNVLVSRHGPVVAHTKTGDYLALEAVNLMPDDRASDGLFALDMARNLNDVAHAADLITTPAENLLAATRTHIGLFVTGTVPIRKSGEAQFPVDGASGDFDWIGFASGVSLPHIIDPESGLLVNTNESVAPPDFPIYMGVDGWHGWRADRIRAVLKKRNKLTLADIAAIQMDVGSAFAATILPELLKIHPANARSATALTLLSRWNKMMTMDAPQPLIFNAWIRQFRIDILAANGVPDARTPAQMDFVAFVLRQGQGAWCGGDCSGLLSRSLAEAAATIPGDPSTWRWGEVHKAVFAHPIFGRLPLVGALFRFGISDPGDDSTVDRGAPYGTSWDAVQGPSFRGVYNLADLDASRFMIAPGQSGDPFSNQATDLLHDWRDGLMLRLPPMPPDGAVRMTLLPGLH